MLYISVTGIPNNREKKITKKIQKIKKNFYFISKVPKNFQYSDLCHANSEILGEYLEVYNDDCDIIVSKG